MKNPFFLLSTFIFLIMLVETNSTYIDKKKTVYNIVQLESDKYKECIDACNACVASCKKCESMCLKEKGAKMNQCIQLCRETIAACTAALQLMTLNSVNSKEICAVAAKICDRCATECEKFSLAHCKDCATLCRKAAKMCRTI
jgi:hypothetical protein